MATFAIHPTIEEETMPDFSQFNPQESKVILIGTSHYDNPNDFSDIKPIENNIADLAKIIKNEGICGITDVVPIINKNRYEAATQLAEESKDVSDTLIVYYAGHGHRSKNTLFLTTKDSKSDLFDESYIDFNKFYKRINSSSAQKRIIILDCCYSGVATMGNTDVNLEEELHIEEVKGVYILAASLSNKQAEYDNSERHTFFTAELIDTLKNGIENNSPFISLNELFQEIRKNLLQKKKPEPSRSDKLSEATFNLFKNTQYQEQNTEIDLIFDINDPKYLNGAPFTEMPTHIIAHRRVVKEVEEKIEESNHAPLYIKGIGGLGKTTFAQAYTWHNKDRYDKILWVNVIKNNFQAAFYTDEKLITSLDVGHIKSDLVINKFGEIIKGLCQLEGKNLLVIDGLEEEINRTEKEGLLALQKSNRWKVLLTSRADISKFSAYKLGFLSEPEAIQLFTHYYKQEISDDNKEEVIKLLRFFNYHTLMVELIARTLKESLSLTAGTVLQQFKNKGLKSFSTSITPTREWEETTAYDYILEIFDLSNLREEEKQVMLHLAVLPSVFISFEDLVTFTQKEAKELSEFESALKQLHKKGWVSRKGNTFLMHLVIQEVIKERLKPTVENCHVLLDFFGPKLTELSESQPEKQFSFTRYIPFIQNLTLIFNSPTEEYAHLIYQLGILNHALFGYNESVFQQTLRAVEIREKLLPENHPDLANSYDALGDAYQSKAEYDKALEFYQLSFNIRKEIFGEKHPDLANSYNNLGNIYSSKGDYDKALDFYQQSFNIRKEVLSKKHPQLASSYNNLGSVYHSKGDYDKALEFHQQSFNIRKEVLGEKHPDLASSYNNLGGVYQSKAEYDKALEFFQQSFNIIKEVLGEKHPDLATSYNNLGLVYQAKGEYDKALEFFQQSFNITKEVLGEKHPQLATSYNNLGGVYQDKGEYDKALEFHQQDFNITKEVLGEKHPDLATSYNNLGSVYQDKGEYDKALEFFQQSFNIIKEVLGKKHPDLASSYNNLGLVYQAKGEYDKALEFHQQDFNITKEVFGEKHPKLATSYNNLGGVYDSKGEYDKALEFYQQSFNITKEVLGEKHPKLATSYNNLGSVYHSKGDYDKALEFYQQSFDIRKEVLGEKHPKLASSYNNLGGVYKAKGEYDKALEFYQQSFDIRKEVLGEKHLDTAVSCELIAVIYFQKKNFRVSKTFFEKALLIYNRIFNRFDKRISRVKKSIKAVNSHIKASRSKAQQNNKRQTNRRKRKKRK